MATDERGWAALCRAISATLCCTVSPVPGHLSARSSSTVCAGLEAIEEGLEALPESQQVMLKLSIPEQPGLFQYAGGTHGKVAIPGQTSVALVDLAPGRYAVLGDTVQQFEVVAHPATPAATPEAAAAPERFVIPALMSSSWTAPSCSREIEPDARRPTIESSSSQASPSAST